MCRSNPALPNVLSISLSSYLRAVLEIYLTWLRLYVSCGWQKADTCRMIFNIRKPFAVIRDEWKGVEVVNYQWLYVWSKRSGDAHDSSA